MHLTYNGIDLKVVKPELISREVVYDPSGRDYIGTHWKIVVVAIYAPDSFVGPGGGTQSYVTAGSSRLLTKGTAQDGTGEPNLQPDARVPNQFRTESPVWTDVALRHKLSQPAKPLRVTFDSGLDTTRFQGSNTETGELLLESPGKLLGSSNSSNAHCDLINGPLPQVGNIQDVFGNGRTFLVVFGIETRVNDCQTGTSPAAADSPLLSNQWTASLAYDEQYLSTRTITGVAVFRADAVRTFVKDPDRYRLSILPAVPGNCKRMIDELTQHPDGYTYSYTVRDIEQAITYLDRPLRTDGVPRDDRNPRNITVFDIEVNRGYEQQGSRAAVKATLDTFVQLNFAGIGEGSITQAGKDVQEGGEKAGKLHPVAGAILWLLGKGTEKVGKSIDAAAGLAIKTTLLANELLPQFQETITVSVAGNRFAKMSELQYLAFAAAFGQVTTPLGLRRGGVAGFLAGQAGLAGGTLLGGAVGAMTGLPGGDLIGGALGAGVAAGASLLLPAHALDFLATANVYDITYSPTRKQLQFTLTTSYGGLVDYVVGGTAGGWRAITGPIPDDVKGGDWPQSAKNNYVLSGNTTNPLSDVHLPPIPDKDVEIAVAKNAPGIGPPVFNDGSGRIVMGTNMTAIIAQKLMEECELPPPMAKDAALFGTGNPGDVVGFGILRSSGRQLLP